MILPSSTSPPAPCFCSLSKRSSPFPHSPSITCSHRCLTQFFDSAAVVAHGVLRGMALQRVGSVVNVAVYVLGLPIAYYLAFKVQLNLGGLWIGAIIAAVLLSLSLFLYIFYWTDWAALATEISAPSTTSHAVRPTSLFVNLFPAKIESCRPSPKKLQVKSWKNRVKFYSIRARRIS